MGIYLSDRLKAELTVCRTFCPKPEPDAFFCIREYARDTFCQPVIAEKNFFLIESAVFMIETLSAFDSDFIEIIARKAMHKVI